jgi:hypothetical protein
MSSPLNLYRLTMPYTLARFWLSLLLALLSGVLLAVCLSSVDGVGSSLAQYLEDLMEEDLGEDGPVFAMLSIWLAGTVGLHFVIMHYAGYLLKAGY